MRKIRKVVKSSKSVPTIEGAGVHLKRAFGFFQEKEFDPFLLLDDFHSDNPNDYTAGFPRHPHRGIETVTYILHGEVKHEDSLGNRGTIGPGGVQWMTAGSGIIHSEMPQEQPDYLQGLQLWINLPGSLKMTQPRYRNIEKEQIPEICSDSGIIIKVICGKYNGIPGPVINPYVNVEYLDVWMPVNGMFIHIIPGDYNVFAYIVSGEGFFDADEKEKFGSESLVIF